MSQAFIGKPAPDFNVEAVVDGAFKKVSLADYKGKYLILFFYPLDLYESICYSLRFNMFLYYILLYYFSTFVCPTEIISFSDRVEEFRTIGCEVVAASTDSEFSHLAW